ncbi:dTDP-glucose 4,6-dehydratase [Tepidimonas thermarum]|uniref:dTDP-glucose 4,6-dehydratase n=1 Tax=Tepidimonas thermarum TaxID=335431 RepID=A0A554X4S9_9BURK|nr:NAD-dependent 4,6-dehydratase LegB [Tepidimonas thermarum]TSE30847.1 dTDP-glucose 4,6-dehydratase [Tepidimonas thermarum]
MEIPQTTASSAAPRCLVTGADGFIGSHLVEMLVARGFRVRALAQYNSFNHWGWLEGLPCLPEIDVLTGDIRDPHFCRRMVEGVDIVFHLAALIAIPYSYAAPDSYVDTNVRGTLNMCQAAHAAGVKRFIHTSTSEVYGTARYVPIDEAHPLQPQSPYSASKIGADAIAMSFFSSFGLPVTVARPFNTYGPRQSARAVIPTIISQIAAGRRRIELGDLRPTRDFNYVEDTCRGMIALAECPGAVGEVVNIGSNTEISIGETVHLIRELMGSDIEIAQDERRLRPSQSEVYRLWCDNRKIVRLTGFTPRVSLREGLIRTIAWFRDENNLRRYKVELYNV